VQLSSLHSFLLLASAGTSKFMPTILDSKNASSSFEGLHGTLKTTTTTTTTSRSITLVQGPPGTGKTTFLVSTLMALLTDPSTRKQRTLVCAPSNRAITVVAERFIEAAKVLNRPPPACLVGVESKLSDGSASSVDSIFVYSYLDRIAENLAATQLNPQQLASIQTYIKHKTPQMFRTLSPYFARIEYHTREGDPAGAHAQLDELIATVEHLDAKSVVAELLSSCR